LIQDDRNIETNSSLQYVTIICMALSDFPTKHIARRNVLQPKWDQTWCGNLCSHKQLLLHRA